MKYCRKCGAQQNDSAQFCNKCGEKFPNVEEVNLEKRNTPTEEISLNENNETIKKSGPRALAIIPLIIVALVVIVIAVLLFGKTNKNYKTNTITYENSANEYMGENSTNNKQIVSPTYDAPEKGADKKESVLEEVKEVVIEESTDSSAEKPTELGMVSEEPFDLDAYYDYAAKKGMQNDIFGAYQQSDFANWGLSGIEFYDNGNFEHYNYSKDSQEIREGRWNIQNDALVMTYNDDLSQRHITYIWDRVLRLDENSEETEFYRMIKRTSYQEFQDLCNGRNHSRAPKEMPNSIEADSYYWMTGSAAIDDGSAYCMDTVIFDYVGEDEIEVDLYCGPVYIAKDAIVHWYLYDYREYITVEECIERGFFQELKACFSRDGYIVEMEGY